MEIVDFDQEIEAEENLLRIFENTSSVANDTGYHTEETDMYISSLFGSASGEIRTEASGTSPEHKKPSKYDFLCNKVNELEDSLIKLQEKLDKWVDKCKRKKRSRNKSVATETFVIRVNAAQKQIKGRSASETKDNRQSSNVENLKAKHVSMSDKLLPKDKKGEKDEKDIRALLKKTSELDGYAGDDEGSAMKIKKVHEQKKIARRNDEQIIKTQKEVTKKFKNK